MISSRHTFYAMGSDCAVQLVTEDAPDFETFARAAEAEVVRIEKRYSRYRADSELTRINAAAANGVSVRIDDETEALVDYAKACFAKSDGAFDITSGVLRRAWDFSSSHLPSQASIDALLPRAGLDKVSVSGGSLHFSQAGMGWILVVSARSTLRIVPQKLARDWARDTALSTSRATSGSLVVSPEEGYR